MLSSTRAGLRRCARGSRLTRAHSTGPATAIWGNYTPLDPASALSSYPEPLPVPDAIPRPAYVPDNFFTHPIWEHSEPKEEVHGGPIALGSEDEAKLRTVASTVAEILAELGTHVKPGVTTEELDSIAHNLITSRWAYPSPLGYSHFPKSITTSVNNVIAHGIPDGRPLEPEDIVNLDLTIYLDGFHGDTSATFLLPNTDKAGRDLVAATEEALDLAIRVCRPGERYNEIGKTIEEFAKRHGFSVNEQFCGHGIGRRFHQHPYIIHCRNTEHGTMKPGDCFTIEPALVQGSRSRGKLWDDGWTVSTETGARSAQAEHQILITEDGADILTARS